MRKQRGALAAAVAALVLGLGAAPAARAQQDQITISLAAIGFGFATNYIAEDMGYWSQSGLKVNFVMIAGVGSTNAVISRSVDFTNSPLTSIIRANIRGQKIFAIGTAVDGIGQEVVVSTTAARAAAITTDMPMEKRAAALRGRTIAVDGPNTIAHAMLRYVARKSGIDPERELTLANMAPEAAMAAMKRGSADGFVAALPWTFIPAHDGYGMVIASGPRGDFPELMPHAGNMVVTQPDFCDKRPGVCDRVMDGYAKAAAYIREHPVEARAIVKKRFAEMDPQVFETSFEFTRRWTSASTKINDAVFASSQRFMIVGGMIKPEEALTSFSDIYTNKYAK